MRDIYTFMTWHLLPWPETREVMVVYRKLIDAAGSKKKLAEMLTSPTDEFRNAACEVLGFPKMDDPMVPFIHRPTQDWVDGIVKQFVDLATSQQPAEAATGG